MPMIEIWDGSSVALDGLLDRVQEAADIDWTILELWATGRDDATDIVALERKATESPYGLTMSAGEVRDLAGRLLQVIDGIIVGYRDRQPDRGDSDLRSTAEVVIEAIDSTLWRIYARDEAVIDRLRGHYDDVREVVPEASIPPVHET